MVHQLIRLSNTQLHKIGQSGGFLGRILGSLLKTGLLLIKNVLKPLGKSVSIPSRLRAAAAATDGSIKKKIFGSSVTTLVISNEGMNEILKMVKSLEKSGLLIKDASEKIKNKAKRQKGKFLIVLLGTLGASLLRNLLTGKDTIKASEGTIRTGQNF